MAIFTDEPSDLVLAKLYIVSAISTAYVYNLLLSKDLLSNFSTSIILCIYKFQNQLGLARSLWALTKD
jgi:hypothetical protein